MKKIVIAVTGASGSVYADLLLKRISSLKKYIVEVALVFSENGEKVWQYELDKHIPLPNDKLRIANNNNLFDKISSGSSAYSSMIIIPASMGTIGRISAGISNDLITRAADVMLKEKRDLIIVPRESPLSNIHLRNLEFLSASGATIMPASPFFYQKPTSMEDLLYPFTDRILDKIGIPSPVHKWEGKE